MIGVVGGVVGVVSSDSSRIIDKCLLLKSTNSLSSNAVASIAASFKQELGLSWEINFSLLLLEVVVFTVSDLDGGFIGEQGGGLPAAVVF